MAGTTWSSSTIQGTIVLSGGNLTATASTTGSVRSVDNRNTGKFYWEVKMLTGGAPGLGNAANSYNDYMLAASPNGNVYRWDQSLAYTFSSSALVANDYFCFAVDLDNRLFWVRKNAVGLWNNSATANPATGAGGYNYSGLSTLTAGIAPWAQFASGDSLTLNSGDTAFIGSVPAGFTSGWATPGDATEALVTTLGTEVVYARDDAPIFVTAAFVEVWASTSNRIKPYPAIFMELI